MQHKKATFIATNNLRLTNTPVGILYNFAPAKDQCERYYYDVNAKTIAAF